MGRTKTDTKALIDSYHRLLDKTILAYQDPITGLLPGFVLEDGSISQDAWVRDNVYGILAVWGMSLVYKKRSDNQDFKANGFHLEQRVVKLMRGLLFAMMKQADKVEAFKSKRSTKSALHAKYDLRTGNTVVGDDAWGHLQIDATSLYILVLAQMTATGLQIVYTLDEVAFIQNLVFYIESAYVTPDYGIWERGDKTNNGQPELNASSIGMAKAAMEAINGLDLFGSRGGPSSVINVLYDEVQQCNAKLMSLLPRESSSKEIDAALLTIISFPAFAVESVEMINIVRENVDQKLRGRYGCSRFLRDGYQTVKEDSSRLYYEPAELKIFENIECEWPLFFCYFLIDSVFREDRRDMAKFYKLLQKVALRDEDDDNVLRLPELYYVPYDKTDMEYQHPHSQDRCPGKKRQTMWAQSLFLLGGLLFDNLIAVGEIDPLNRRFSTQSKPDLIVQISLLAEDDTIANSLTALGVKTQTIKEVQETQPNPIKVLTAKNLSLAYQTMGACKKMGLSGRPYHPIGELGTCQIYDVSGNLFVIIPQYLDQDIFYFSLDARMVVELIKTQLAYLKANWKQMGRPTFPIPVLHSMMGLVTYEGRSMFKCIIIKPWLKIIYSQPDEGPSERSAFMKLLQAFMSGYSTGVKVKVGHLSEFLSTSCVTKLTFLERLPHVKAILKHRDSGKAMLLSKDDSFERNDKRPLVTRGSVRRSRQEILESTPSGTRSAPRRNSSGLLKLKSPSTSPVVHIRKGSLHGYSLAQLVEELKSSTSVSDKADVLHYIYTNHGRNCKISVEGGNVYTVETLLEELYDKVCQMHHWSLVRHVAGMLDKKVEGLAQMATELLVRQKQFSVGSPSTRREIAVSQPMPVEELYELIKGSCVRDHSSISLTQEILSYLVMFIRAEPSLFREMLRLRIGLIYEVMIFELSRVLDCENEDAHEELLNLSPSELKNLLHHILSGKEFRIDQDIDQSSSSLLENSQSSQLSVVIPSKRDMHGELYKEVKAIDLGHQDDEPDREGQWRRRRRLDGALNRLPPDFYILVWHILERCAGIQIKDHYLPSHPTVQEMTSRELKFALKVESLLNTVDDPEYRQLLVEVLMVLSLVVKDDPAQPLGHTIVVNHILQDANRLFVEDQRHHENGYSKQCCCKAPGSCGGHENICIHFYDSAPSGRHGTMSYISRAVAEKLRHMPSPTGDCHIS